jgi:uncharacterized membrane protein (TIGR02234 family)
MTGARLKLVSLALVGVLAALVLLAWSQVWFSVTVVDGDSEGHYEVAGDMVAGALPPLALASFALVLALAIAGPVFRVVLGALEALLGVTVIVVTSYVLSDPVAAFAGDVAERTGDAGIEHLRELVTDVGTTAWPVLAIVAGALMAVLGVAIAVTGHRWPRSGRKYSRSRLEPAAGATPVDEWDALSEGDDPTGAGAADEAEPPR